MSDRKNPMFVLDPVEPRRHFAAGFVASYFPATTFTGKAVTRTDAAVAFNWGKNAPAAGIRADAFSARYTTQLNPTATGRHALYVSTEGGVRVWVNHKLVLNKPAAPGVITHYKTTLSLTANTPADVQIEYRHDSGKGYVGVAYVEPGGSKVTLGGDDATARAPVLADRIDHARVFAADQLSSTYRTLKTKDGAALRSEPARPDWLRAAFTDWTSGTFAGAMWELDKTFGGWDAAATTWTTPLAGVKIVGDAFDREWAAYKPYYDATASPAAKKVLLDSAALKMTAWSKTVRGFKTPELVSHGTDKSADYGLLMDQTMDMDHLLWAGRITGDTTYRDRVLAHMKTVAATMVRPDGSVFQRGYFNSKTGRFVVGENYQGYSDKTTWSRAQAWAMHSFGLVAAATGDATILATARRVSDYFITHTPADGVPYWDFQAPNIPKTYRDTSAAAIAADALTLLAPLVPAGQRPAYTAARDKILTALTSDYLAAGTKIKGVLQHGAANVPKNKGPDASLMFGDYYFLRAMNDYTAAVTI